jgi:hypothetical protein
MWIAFKEKRSEVWKYFEQNVNDKAQAKCRLCNGLFKIQANLSSTSLKYHLQNKHMLDFKGSSDLQQSSSANGKKELICK